MVRWNVSVAAEPGWNTEAQAICHRLASSWRWRPAADFAAVRAATTFSQDSVKSTDAVIVVADSHVPQTITMDLLEQLDQAGLPVLVLTDEASGQFFESAGALVERLDAPDDRICAALHGLLSRQCEVKRLRGEAFLGQHYYDHVQNQLAQLHEELQLAAVMQREFLPRDLPSLHGIEFGAMWRPTTYVSGDIYDVRRLDEDHVGVFIADAIGHGVPAALMTMVICRSLVTKEISGRSYRLVPPSEVLERLNAEMIRHQGHTTRFATAVYGLVNCRTRTLTLAGAGHPAPLLLHADAGSAWLETPGGLLGVFDDETFPETQVQLQVGDRVLFYTDGFEWAFSTACKDAPARRVPTSRYRDEFNAIHRQATAAEIVQAVSDHVDDQCGSLHQVDDLTLVCLGADALPVDRPAFALSRRDEQRT